jgi:hypothetical protein
MWIKIAGINNKSCHLINMHDVFMVELQEDQIIFHCRTSDIHQFRISYKEELGGVTVKKDEFNER